VHIGKDGTRRSREGKERVESRLTASADFTSFDT
jgi:hypothetical protein